MIYLPLHCFFCYLFCVSVLVYSGSCKYTIHWMVSKDSGVWGRGTWGHSRCGVCEGPFSCSQVALLHSLVVEAVRDPTRASWAFVVSQSLPEAPLLQPWPYRLSFNVGIPERPKEDVVAALFPPSHSLILRGALSCVVWAFLALASQLCLFGSSQLKNCWLYLPWQGPECAAWTSLGTPLASPFSQGSWSVLPVCSSCAC